MEEIINYISNNQFFSTMIAIVVGSLLTLLSQLFLSNRDRKNKIIEDNKREKRNQFREKPELYIEKEVRETSKIPDIEVFLAPFEIKKEDNDKYRIIFPKEIKDSKNHEHTDFTFRNIGKNDIAQLDIIATFKEHNILVDYSMLENILENGHLMCSYCYDRKIRVGDTITMRLYYGKEHGIVHLFSCTLALLFKDSHGNCYEQPFWYEKNNLYEPFTITHKEYRDRTIVDNY